ncbi:DUF7151 family protein [Saccharospirillum alexandrii]|uniref:DUF7151 family protein n=1 Tax=Saccharospirillum alexandrii TaxID=2448477 RepID=UPI000FD7CCBC|nr:hypothetical protein [Saccharospirillum alexandrii]
MLPAVFFSRLVFLAQRVTTKAPSVLFAICGLVLLATGCAGGSGSDSGGSVNNQSQSPGTALRTSSFESSTLCPSGGVLLELGFDTNKNDILDEDEVQTTQEVCHGTNGTDGSNGTDGADGEDGTDGVNGTDGVDGTPGLVNLVELNVELPGPNCPYGGTRIDSGLDADGNGSLSETEIGSLTQYVCEQQSCLWTDNDDGTTTISCDGEDDRVVLNPDALGFTSRTSCGVSIDHPEVDDATIPLIYTIDAIGDYLKFATLNVLDGDRQVSNSRLLTATMANPAEFTFGAITVYFDTYGMATGGRYQASLNSTENEFSILYFDSELSGGGPVGAIFKAFTDEGGPGVCNRVLSVAD